MIATLRRRLANDQGGFTLIELLVVIIIIGILLAIAVPSYLGFRGRANDSSAKANVRSMVPSVEALFSDKGAYTELTTTKLQLSYDQSITPSTSNVQANQKYWAANVGGTSYCISSTINSTTWKKAGPSGQIVSGPC